MLSKVTKSVGAKLSRARAEKKRKRKLAANKAVASSTKGLVALLVELEWIGILFRAGKRNTVNK